MFVIRIIAIAMLILDIYALIGAFYAMHNDITFEQKEYLLFEEKILIGPAWWIAFYITKLFEWNRRSND